jgi:FixJ family two-component response regulator
MGDSAVPRRRAADSNPRVADPSGAPSRGFRVLLVDNDPGARLAFEAVAASDPTLQLHHAATVHEARRSLAAERVDLALIEPDLPDGSGMTLAQDLARCRPHVQTVLLSSRPDVERALQALRLGATDFLVKPLPPQQAAVAIEQARMRHRVDRHRRRQVHRLRRACRKLSAARKDISQQVDTLCSDMVNAYQELSSQMSHAVCAAEFGNLVRGELDLHMTMQRSLEYMLQKAGPTNAALFLPAMPGEFALGAYVNYDTSASAADTLLQHLADVVAPKVAQRTAPLLIADNMSLSQWIGDDWNYVADAHVLAFPCRHKDETLAVIVLFRDAAQPLDPNLTDVGASIAPVLADHLARIVRIHHRHLPDAD